MYADAPPSTAASTNMWPSRSATMATNSEPGRAVRESVVTERTSTSAPCKVPPTASAISLAENLTAGTLRLGRERTAPHAAGRLVRWPLGRARGLVHLRPPRPARRRPGALRRRPDRDHPRGQVGGHQRGDR